MTPLATAQDVETALGRPLTSTEQAQANWWLRGVEMLIVSRLGDVSGLDRDAVIYVEAESVAGKIRRHGNAESSITVSVDDASVTRRYENSVTAGDISAELWALITPRSTMGAFTIRTRPQVAQPFRRGCW